MKRHTVVFTPEARAQLLELYRRIALNASPAIAARYTDALVSRCEALADRYAAMHKVHIEHSSGQAISRSTRGSRPAGRFLPKLGGPQRPPIFLC